MYYFTVDTHLGHSRIIDYCNRPFSNVHEMNETIIENWNNVVCKNDTVYHLGDFSFGEPYPYLERLNGNIVFIKGNHDKNDLKMHKILEINLEGISITMCHYCMRVWNKSHFNSFHLFGHSHGTLEPIGKSWDVGVDNNNFTPVSWPKIKEIMNKRPDNFNFIKRV